MNRSWSVVALLVAIPLRATALHPDIIDDEHVLSPPQQEATASQDFPFLAQVILTTAHPTTDALDQFVRDRMTSPMLVILAIDPVSRNTVVHFGAKLGVAPTAHSLIASAGDAAFREGDWPAGIQATFAMTGSSIAPVLSRTTLPTPGNGSVALTLAVFGSSFVFITFWLLRRRRDKTAAPLRTGGAYDGGPDYGSGSSTDLSGSSGNSGSDSGGADGGGGSSHW